MKTIAAILCVLVGGCFAATTVEMLAADPNMSTLVSLVTQAGLVDTLNNGTFTIFAPSNAAFDKVPKATLVALGNDMAALTNLLLFHVHAGVALSGDVTNELLLPMASGDNARLNVYSHNHAVTIQGSKISQFDKRASNGVIHVIDSVIMPATMDIVGVVSNTPELSTLLQLVSEACIASALKPQHLTLFAPTNDAFAKLPLSTIAAIKTDKALLIDILSYHVVPSTEYSVGLYNKEHLRTIDAHRDQLTVHADASGIRIVNAMVTKADVSTTNGVIHYIDTVLVPHRHHHSVAVGR